MMGVPVQFREAEHEAAWLDLVERWLDQQERRLDLEESREDRLQREHVYKWEMPEEVPE